MGKWKTRSVTHLSNGDNSALLLPVVCTLSATQNLIEVGGILRAAPQAIVDAGASLNCIMHPRPSSPVPAWSWRARGRDQPLRVL